MITQHGNRRELVVEKKKRLPDEHYGAIVRVHAPVPPHTEPTVTRAATLTNFGARCPTITFVANHDGHGCLLARNVRGISKMSCALAAFSLQLSMPRGFQGSETVKTVATVRFASLF